MNDDRILEMRKFVAPEFVFGKDSSLLAGQYAKNLCVRKALVVSGPIIKRSGWTDRVTDSLAEAGVDAVLFTELSPNPRDSEVMAGAALYGQEGCDSIVAVGGGSPMDCAKAIGVVSTNKRHVLDFEGVDNVPRPCPPLICIPTTAGTASEVSQFSIILDSKRKVKIAIVSKAMIPDAALIDPVLTTTMDASLTAYTGLDALTHAIEAYVSNASSPVTDLHALQAVRLVSEYLVRAIREPDDLVVRGQMLLASLHAGLAFSNAILGAVHAMAHSLGGLLDLPHGQCNALLLDQVMDYNFDYAPERFTDIGRAMGADISPKASRERQKALVLGAIRGLKSEAGVSETLSDLGVKPADIPELTAKAMDDPCMITNPRQPSKEEIARVYEDAC
ncbi:MAG: iron-containing alcohol dehydrogenase [Desulfovibrionaceae bacterium]|nr:iron-containing alcohol dehydrogenase [Desulfovibrionaceae bacterium]